MIQSARERVTNIEDDLLDPEAAPEDMRVVGDGALLASLSKATGRGMRDIVATIQREQDDAIRSPASGVTIVTGGPGTGKTAVALHRAAYLLYADRSRFAGGGILVVGPSGVFVDYIAKSDPGFAETFAVAHEALVDGFMPRELCLDQLPTRIRSRGRTFQCAYRSIAGCATGAGDGGLLIIIEDVTEQLRLAQDEAEQSELLAVFQSLTRDRAGFLTFFEEAGRMVQDLASGTLDGVVRKRHLHTLKGNAAMVGAKVVADLCHRAEEELAIDGAGIGAIVARLQGRWRAIGATLHAVLGERDEELVEIPVAALDQLRRDLVAGASPRDIEQRLASFELEPIDLPLGRLAQYASALATRLGKGDLLVEIESDRSRLDAHRFGPLWASLVHLVRNGVDHGIETPSERAARGKPAAGRMILRAGQAGRALTIEVEDDGIGIDWDAVVKVAEAGGLPHETPSDLLRILLSDGFTTRPTASSTSGRGIGTAAVAQAVTSLGGTLSVRSQRGAGTCWRVVLPIPAAGLGSAAVGPELGAPDAPAPPAYQLSPPGTPL